MPVILKPKMVTVMQELGVDSDYWLPRGIDQRGANSHHVLFRESDWKSPAWCFVLRETTQVLLPKEVHKELHPDDDINRFASPRIASGSAYEVATRLNDMNGQLPRGNPVARLEVVAHTFEQVAGDLVGKPGESANLRECAGQIIDQLDIIGEGVEQLRSRAD